MKFLYYAVRPYGINQGFGANPDYYKRFLDSAGRPYQGHQGVDFQAAHGTPLYAPCEGDAFYTFDSHGGAGIYIRYPDNVKPQYDVILWHLCTKDDPIYKPLIPTDGSVVRVKLGQHIGYTDNSGAPFESSGDHLHFGLLPVDENSAPINPLNGFGGCINPLPYFTGFYAQGYQETLDTVKTASLITDQIATAPISNADKSWLLMQLTKVVNMIKNLFV